MHIQSSNRTHIKSVNLQSGQVLVWFLAFAATLALIFTAVYSVGQITSEKQKTVNAADAAAYSGGMVQARSLNLVAYTNRAVVANEVLIAQMVSLQSWNSYFETSTRNYQIVFQTLGAVTVALPPLSVAMNMLAQTMRVGNTAASQTEKILKTLVPGLIGTWEATFSLWYTGAIKSAFIPPVMALAARDASDSVLKHSVATQGGRKDTPAHLVQANALMLINEMEWQRMTYLYRKAGAGGEERKTSADLLLASRDEFSIKRPGSQQPFVNMFFGSGGECMAFVFRIGSDKQGSTRLATYDRWEAQDTVEFRQKINPDFCDWGKNNSAVPMGWGRSVADRYGSTNGTHMNTGSGAGQLAYKATDRNRGWTGVKELYDVPRDKQGRPHQQEMLYLVAAAKDQQQVPTNEALGFAQRSHSSPVGSTDLKAGFAKDQLFALSQARIFFERPQRDNRDVTGSFLFRADGHKEYASLYNPFWQVRLSEPSSANKALVYGALQLNPALSALTQ